MYEVVTDKSRPLGLSSKSRVTDEERKSIKHQEKYLDTIATVELCSAKSAKTASYGYDKCILVTLKKELVVEYRGTDRWKEPTARKVVLKPGLQFLVDYENYYGKDIYDAHFAHVLYTHNGEQYSYTDCIATGGGNLYAPSLKMLALSAINRLIEINAGRNQAEVYDPTKYLDKSDDDWDFAWGWCPSDKLIVTEIKGGK